jgi:hypothetical protein
MQIAELPLIDEHTTAIDADVGEVWAALLETLGGALSGGAATAFARLVGCTEWQASGPRPLDVGSTIPGFRVTAAVPGHELVLEGRHRFSEYALTFRLDEIDGGRTGLRAESRATFPGVHGRAYRMLVIGTGGHVAAVRRMLTGVKHRAEH